MIKTYNVFYATEENGRVKGVTVQAKQRRTAEKEARKLVGENIIIEAVYQTAPWSGTKELIENNID